MKKNKADCIAAGLTLRKSLDDLLRSLFERALAVIGIEFHARFQSVLDGIIYLPFGESDNSGKHVLIFEIAVITLQRLIDQRPHLLAAR